MMSRLWARAASYLLHEEGATAIEYGMIIAGVSIGISVIAFTLGDQLLALFTYLNDKIASTAMK